VFGENNDTSVIDMYRQGKNVITLNHLAKGILPYISINTQKIMELDGTVRHQMQNEEYGQGSLHKVFDDVKNKIRPFEDYPGRLDPVALIEAGTYIMQYMIINDLTRDLDQYIDPDTMDGVIEVFEIRRRNANTNSADIQINGIRCDLSTGDWNFDQKGSSVLDTKYEKVQGVHDWYEDSQESMFPETLFEKRLGMPSGSTGRTFSLDGFIADGYYNISPFNEAGMTVIDDNVYSLKNFLHKNEKFTYTGSISSERTMSDIGTRFTGATSGFIYPKNVVSSSMEMRVVGDEVLGPGYPQGGSGNRTNLGTDSIAFGGFLKSCQS
jgi:hypothetical protein